MGTIACACPIGRMKHRRPSFRRPRFPLSPIARWRRSTPNFRCAAGGWITVASKNALYVMAQLLIVVGVPLQDVIADAMTTEVVERERPDGSPKPKAEEIHVAWTPLRRRFLE